MPRLVEDARPMFEKAFPNTDDQLLVGGWLSGMEKVLGVDYAFGTDTDKETITHVIMLYPYEVVAKFKQPGSAEECIQRLLDKKFLVHFRKHNGQDRMFVGYPLPEALRLAKVWRNDAENASLTTFSFLAMDKTGLLMGHMEPL